MWVQPSRSLAQRLARISLQAGRCVHSGSEFGAYQGRGHGHDLKVLPYTLSERVSPLEETILNLRNFQLKSGVTVPGILDPSRSGHLPYPTPIGPAPVSTPLREYIIPGASNSNNVFEDPVTSLKIPFEAPATPGTQNVKKEAARLVVIRRIKMNKHKLRKLRKKMHYTWKKAKERRYVRKEKAYLDEKYALIQAAWKFDAKDYVASVIKRAKEEPLPRKWTDPLMPEWFREQEMAKEARLKKFQKVVNIYLNSNIKIKMPK